MKKISLIILLSLVFLISISTLSVVNASGYEQQPTIIIPTVTGTYKGVTVTVPLSSLDPVNVRSGPSTLYDLVGTLLPGQEVAALGKSSDVDNNYWIMIRYFGAPDDIGWVYDGLVDLSPGELPIIEPPPTVTPAVTQTVNATLAAQFITTPIPTRLATFTPSDPMIVPTYADVSRTSFLGKIPMGLVVIILGGLGGLLAIFSSVRQN